MEILNILGGLVLYLMIMAAAGFFFQFLFSSAIERNPEDTVKIYHKYRAAYGLLMALVWMSLMTTLLPGKVGINYVKDNSAIFNAVSVVIGFLVNIKDLTNIFRKGEI